MLDFHSHSARKALFSSAAMVALAERNAPDHEVEANAQAAFRASYPVEDNSSSISEKRSEARAARRRRDSILKQANRRGVGQTIVTSEMEVAPHSLNLTVARIAGCGSYLLAGIAPLILGGIISKASVFDFLADFPLAGALFGAGILGVLAAFKLLESVLTTPARRRAFDLIVAGVVLVSFIGLATSLIDILGTVDGGAGIRGSDDVDGPLTSYYPWSLSLDLAGAAALHRVYERAKTAGAKEILVPPAGDAAFAAAAQVQLTLAEIADDEALQLERRAAQRDAAEMAFIGHVKAEVSLLKARLASAAEVARQELADRMVRETAPTQDEFDFT